MDQINQYLEEKINLYKDKEDEIIQKNVESFMEENYLLMNKLEKDKKDNEENVKEQIRNVVSSEEQIINQELRTVHSLSNGSKYIGEIQEGKPHG